MNKTTYTLTLNEKQWIALKTVLMYGSVNILKGNFGEMLESFYDTTKALSEAVEDDFEKVYTSEKDYFHTIEDLIGEVLNAE